MILDIFRTFAKYNPVKHIFLARGSTCYCTVLFLVKIGLDSTTKLLENNGPASECRKFFEDFLSETSMKKTFEWF